uniref:Bifunctional metallophosphatase/5'-nucleotidase n=1 Tax=Eiseniibacteriota bacterium TaxID=2212470 RepID=A0A832I5A2_UNCEI
MMKRLVLVAACLAALVAPAAASETRLAILSTTDVKGKTGPCGCKIPRGGFARRAAFADSVRAGYDHVMVVENGGFFPDEDIPELAPFQMEAMKMLGTVAAGVGEREFRYGLAFLRENAKAKAAPLTVANLLDRATGKPLFEPYRIVTFGSLKVGVFAVFPSDGDLGPAADSVTITDPVAAAKRVVAELRKKGAKAIVALSSLGKVGSEDLAAAVDGIDVVIAGRNVPVAPRARSVRGTAVVFGGEQGHYIGRSVVTFGPNGAVTGREGETFSLGPEMTDHAAVAKAVAAFEADLSARRGTRSSSTADPHAGHNH